MERLRAVVLGIAVICCLPEAIFPDVVAELDERRETTHVFLDDRVEEFRIVVTLGDQRARMDRGGKSYILKADQGKFLVVHHSAKVYQVVNLPVDIWRYVPESSRAVAPKVKRFLSSNVELTDTGREQQFGAWQARLWRVHAVFPFLTSADEFELWLSSDVDLNEVLYKELLKGVGALDPTINAWLTEVLALDGIVIRSEARKGSGQSTKVHETSQLVSVRQEDVSQGHYEVPAGYREVPFRVDMAIDDGSP